MKKIRTPRTLALGLALAWLSACSGTSTSSSGNTSTAILSAAITAARLSTTVSCGSGDIVLAGGCKCDNSNGITSSFRVDDSTWSCSCDTEGDEQRAYVLCSRESLAITSSSAAISADDDATTVTCGGGETLFGAGITCGTGLSSTATSIYFSDSSTVTGQCDNLLDEDGSAEVHAYCSSDSISVERVSAAFSIGASGGSGTASCPSGKVLLGGGCECNPTSNELDNSYPSSTTQWSCACSGTLTPDQTGTATAICI